MLNQKTIFFLFYIGAFPFFAKAQTNLVINPSFETYSACPSGQDELYKATGWISYKYSPDYMNACASPGGMSVPSNWGGYQQAANGNAYAALATFGSLIYGGNFKEYIGGALTSTLNIGVKYYVSFKACLSIDPTGGGNCASDKIGVKFSTIPFSVSSPAPTNNISKVYSNSKITDTLNWTKVFGSFISDSAYKHIIIGNFFTDANTDTLIMDSSPICNYSYYFVDDICVSTDSSFTYNYSTNISENGALGSRIRCFPNPIENILTIRNVSKESLTIEIVNSLGEILFTDRNKSDENIEIDFNSVRPGIIFIKITDQHQIKTYKLLKL